MRAYKLNLLLVHSRYGDLEQRVIGMFVRDRAANESWWFSDMEILLVFLLEDGLMHCTDQTRQQGGLIQKCYRLTEKGQEYVAQWPTN